MNADAKPFRISEEGELSPSPEAVLKMLILGASEFQALQQSEVLDAVNFTRMSDQQHSAGSVPPAKPITVKAEWTMVLVCAALVVFFEILGVLSEPHTSRRGDVNLFSALGGITWWLGHALWVSMDRRRRGLELGAWRYAVVFFGFLAVWLYLAIEYRMKGLLLILVSIGLYLVMAVMVFGVTSIAAGF